MCVHWQLFGTAARLWPKTFLFFHVNFAPLPASRRGSSTHTRETGKGPEIGSVRNGSRGVCSDFSRVRSEVPGEPCFGVSSRSRVCRNRCTYPLRVSEIRGAAAGHGSSFRVPEFCRLRRGVALTVGHCRGLFDGKAPGSGWPPDLVGCGSFGWISSVGCYDPRDFFYWTSVSVWCWMWPGEERQENNYVVAGKRRRTQQQQQQQQQQ